MSQAINSRFWQNPPWQGGVAKQRLGLRPVDADAWFEPASQVLLEHKRTMLNERYHDVVATLPAASAADELLREIPDWGEFFNREPVYPDHIADVAAVRAEDLCLLDVPDEQRLVAACVCAPSYWRVQDKIGLPLWDVHGPVLGMNARIGSNVERFIANIAVGQVFERRNWFLHGDAELAHFDKEGALSVPVAEWIVRSERQTVCKLSDRFVLFTISINCEPIYHIAAYPRACRDLSASLARMDADEIAYFGGVEKHQRLAEYVAVITGG